MSKLKISIWVNWNVKTWLIYCCSMRFLYDEQRIENRWGSIVFSFVSKKLSWHRKPRNCVFLRLYYHNERRAWSQTTSSSQHFLLFFFVIYVPLFYLTRTRRLPLFFEQIWMYPLILLRLMDVDNLQTLCYSREAPDCSNKHHVFHNDGPEAETPSDSLPPRRTNPWNSHPQTFTTQRITPSHREIGR